MHYTTVDSTVVLNALLELVKEFFIFMLPVIGFLAGVWLVWRMLASVLFRNWRF